MTAAHAFQAGVPSSASRWAWARSQDTRARSMRWDRSWLRILHPSLLEQPANVALAVLVGVLLALVGLGDEVLGADHVVVLQPLAPGPDLRHLRLPDLEHVAVPLQQALHGLILRADYAVHSHQRHRRPVKLGHQTQRTHVHTQTSSVHS